MLSKVTMYRIVPVMCLMLGMLSFGISGIYGVAEHGTIDVSKTVLDESIDDMKAHCDLLSKKVSASGVFILLDEKGDLRNAFETVLVHYKLTGSREGLTSFFALALNRLSNRVVYTTQETLNLDTSAIYMYTMMQLYNIAKEYNCPPVDNGSYKKLLRFEKNFSFLRRLQSELATQGLFNYIEASDDPKDLVMQFIAARQAYLIGIGKQELKEFITMILSSMTIDIKDATSLKLNDIALSLEQWRYDLYTTAKRFGCVNINK